ncbi:fimbrial chaperone [Superficieibacter sp. BNK-5]|uniref:fimbrial chaperone n=1 Tax=Superficieibacter sp. BNK-5 TaxID=3376142 RepID=UPI0039BF4304
MPARLLKLFFIVVLSINTTMATAGIVVGGTRVIYASDKPDVTISIYNKDLKLPYLIQTWVDPFNKDDKSKPPFTVIPPVSRIEPNQEKILRVVKTAGELPKDRESVFWLNVKNIPPASDRTNTNTLEVAIKTRIKLFWRPATLNATPESVASTVKWHIDGKNLIVENPSPIHINVMDIIVDGKDVPLNIIRPFEKVTLPLPAGVVGHAIIWRFVNDYGAISQPIKIMR